MSKDNINNRFKDLISYNPKKGSKKTINEAEGDENIPQNNNDEESNLKDAFGSQEVEDVQTQMPQNSNDIEQSTEEESDLDMDMDDESGEITLDVSEIVKSVDEVKNNTSQMNMVIDNIVSSIERLEGVLDSRISNVESIMSNELHSALMVMNRLIPPTPEQKLKQMKYDTTGFNLTIDDFEQQNLEKNAAKESLKGIPVSVQDYNKYDPQEVKRSLEKIFEI